ncbi:MAG: UDP-N-acetylglucosamine 2-epimerase, partial [Segatella oulorum]
RQLLQAIARSVEGTGIRVIAPLRQRAAHVVEALLADEPQASSITLVPPQGYLAFAYLAAHARGIITDSGNVAEEATFNQVACITLNSYTEHIETVKQGTNVLVGENPDLLHAAVDDMVAGRWKTSSLPERWDGRTAERILQILY